MITRVRHDCHAQTNLVQIKAEWDGDILVTTFGCKKCHRTWELRQTREQLRAVLRGPGLRGDTETHCHCGAPYGGSDHCPECLCEQYESGNCGHVFVEN